MMMVCHLRFATTRHAFSMCWLYQSMTLTSSIMDPFSFKSSIDIVDWDWVW